MPRITRPQVYRVVREMLPRERFGPAELLRWLEVTQLSNERARLSHEKCRAACRAPPVEHRQASLPKAVVVILAARLRIDRLAVSVSRDYPAATILAWCGRAHPGCFSKIPLPMARHDSWLFPVAPLPSPCRTSRPRSGTASAGCGRRR